MSALEGEAAAEFDKQFQKIFGGDASAEKIAAVMKALGETARTTGRDVEHGDDPGEGYRRADRG